MHLELHPALHSVLQPGVVHRVARLDLEAVSIGSVIAASVPALSPLALQAPTVLAITLAVVATPIASVLGARALVRRGLRLR